MQNKQPFRRRILIAFATMTILVSGVFSLSIVAIVHLIEEHLVSEELALELGVVVQQDLKSGQAPRLDSRTRFFASNYPQYAIPQRYADLPEGFSEQLEGERAFYIFTEVINGDRYLLVQEQSDFEKREQVLFNVVLAGFLLSVLGALVLGWLMSERVMRPVSKLANQVRHRDQLLPLAPALAPEYPDDEVGQLAAAFDSTLGRLRQSLERERLFTSDVSHELRTPLMVIASSCELLSQVDLEPTQRKQVQRIERASAEMQDLVQTFLQLARVKGNETLFAGSASLRQIADEQVETWAPLMREKGLDFQVEVQALHEGVYNPTLLRTVMANLLRNALHYTETGFVKLTLQQNGFRVEDSGVGIPEQHHEQIFDPFVRGEQARGEGLGLGLSLVKRICAHQGWQISVHSLPVTGSCFEVTFQAAS
ncbi:MULTISPECIES: HAMP domain-containing sensor histidine kinase [unclassified Pseudomonas]|uniref:sensor histidine kinase n=1 Tax=unclassified Pseudomonas TaxID=196821 RepID=UPI000DAB5E12|nr:MULTISPECIES: HAMP domain-containing sensor histidine kinase [unclassified Pseudomonas]MBD9655150.1 HAMP domain-containing histidine kinase [Pseudomonas sp. PDM12]PZW47977.1 signal transduction histidine kinase [Pseudomonas sp. URMO17WK12:I2]